MRKEAHLGETFNLYPLFIFRVIARTGSVTRAANELFVSQPAVSAHLRTLEDQFGAPLFERTPRGLILTPMGEVVLLYANRLLALTEEMAVAEAKESVQGRVTVAASTTLRLTSSPNASDDFRPSNPMWRLC